jgi:hypothetical protein
VTAGEVDSGAGLSLVVAPSLPVFAAEFAFDHGNRGSAGSSAETVGEVASYFIEPPEEFPDGVTAGKVDSGAGLSLVVVPSLPDFAAEFVFDHGNRGSAGNSAEVVGEVASYFIERPKELSDGVTTGEVDSGAGLSLVSAPLLAVFVAEFAFDHGNRGSAGSCAETVGEDAS